MQLTDRELQTIGPTIRAVAKAHAERLFRPENNTGRRSTFVFISIAALVGTALVDAGIPEEKVLKDIDPTDDILAIMIDAGYNVSRETINSI